MNTVTLNGMTITLDQIAQFAPKVILHGMEQYFPCSIESLLQNALLSSVDPNQLPVNGAGQTVTSISNPTQADLLRNCASNFRVKIDDGQSNGQKPDEHGNVPAPVYVSVQVPPDQSFVDLTYIFLFAYQGAQTARAIQITKSLAGGKFNFQLPDFGKHQADLESVTVRVTSDFSKLLFVRYEAHGHSTYAGYKAVLWRSAQWLPASKIWPWSVASPMPAQPSTLRRGVTAIMAQPSGTLISPPSRRGSTSSPN